MKDLKIQDIPKIHSEILDKCMEIEFHMPSDLYIGTLLKTLISSKPKAKILELGTGIGLSLSWMVDGMDEDSKLITVDNDPKLIRIAKSYFGNDKRVEIVCQDGSEWIESYRSDKFDLIFADTWPGKFRNIDEVLELVKIGGFYVIDDMSPKPNWPEGHQEKVTSLIDYLDNREDFNLSKIDWSTGVVLAVRKY
ncbi:class I SAM-dependent methyltransferase [Flavobacteriaceae bacterium F89]|uniref:Class I SAM-dependent methyltransferase n=1 Tax=Cerina litoralis TaxID=2874477 RepID=A0AAE3EX88_9FLAO|nr:class I SAM-dependent methyltransferase [Cerina litoralis]MCG2461799.1 class I SAM-dependent methyltransferase [Cerina litoralis]